MFAKIDPTHLKVGQKFVYREKYLELIEVVPDIFCGFAICNGLADLGAYFVIGLNGSDDIAIACYLPPIIEHHDSNLIVMDGVNRNFIGRQTGQALNSILVEHVDADFPCSTRSWKEVRIVPLSEKPKDLKDRYFDLRKELFRDLKYLGIDG